MLWPRPLRDPTGCIRRRSWRSRARFISRRTSFSAIFPKPRSFDSPPRTGECAREPSLAQDDSQKCGSTALFPNAKTAEDQIQDVVGSGVAGERVEGAKGTVEVEQQHLVRNRIVYRPSRGFQSGQRLAHQLLLAKVGKHAALLLRAIFAAHAAQDLASQIFNALAGESRGA